MTDSFIKYTDEIKEKFAGSIKDAILLQFPEIKCFQLFPNLIDMLQLSYWQGRGATCILFMLYVFFFLKFNKFHALQKLGVKFVGIVFIVMHILEIFCFNGLAMLNVAMMVAGFATCLSFIKEVSSILNYTVGIYLVSLSVAVYTVKFAVYKTVICTITSLMLYIAVAYYLWEPIHFIFLKGVIMTIIITMYIELSIIYNIFSLVGDNYFFIPPGFSATCTLFLLTNITVMNCVLCVINELRNF